MSNILIVEDSIMISQAIKILLENEGMSVESTSDGSKVVDLIKEKSINLVILDLMMPGVSGVDVFKNIKNDENTKDIPVIILTAKTDAMKWQQELKECNKFMTKPFDNKELVESVKNLIK